MLLLKIDHVYGYDTKHSTKLACALDLSHVARLDGRGQCDLFLVTTLRYAASDNFNYLHGCLMLLPSIFSWVPGSNTNSIVIMGNVSIHHVNGVVVLLETLGVLVFYLLPYSPELNPIEELFSKVKPYLKATENHLNETLETLLLMAFSSITVNDCISWINHAGYK